MVVGQELRVVAIGTAIGLRWRTRTVELARFAADARSSQLDGADDVVAAPDHDASGQTQHGEGRYMPDTKALFTAQFDAARTAWTEKDEPAAAEFLRSAIITARSDPGLRRELASALFHLGKLSQKLGRAGEAEAEPLLTEALAISEGLFGREHAALAPVLNELGRLHFHRSQYARAADVVERLLAIARAKGEENADVATALAGLAVVKRKLGDDASAEALYRDALRIREKVLEPRHMATVVTLEHLSETCAARGNFGEALALLRRALATRELTSAPNHSTVQVARSRVAALELQVAAAAAPSTTVPSPIDSKAPEFLGESEPRVLPLAARLSQRVKTPAVTAAAATGSSTAPSMPTWPSRIAISPPPSPVESARPSASSTGDWRPIVAENLVDSPERARKKRTTVYSFAGVAAVAVVIAELLMVGARAGSGTEAVSTEMSAEPRRNGGAPVVTGPASLAPTTPVIRLQGEQRTPTSTRPELRSPRVEIHLNSLDIPSIPAPPSAESILRRAMEPQRRSDTNRTEASNEPSRPASANIVSAHTSPKLIGRVPDPGFPDALLRSGTREGQVVVRFMVNDLGRVDVASMIVERSDDELFTEAVRDVLPLFRFEPARTLGLESRPVAAWVSVPFRFTTKKR
jgi:TonB family protein